ncbi:MAG: AraC family transcriptional regulator [Acidobacteriota bacterium]
MDRNTIVRTVATRDLSLELRSEFASRVAQLAGSAEKQATLIPRLTLHQRTAPTAACHVTCEPSIVVVAQGRKEIQIGGQPVTYDSSRYLLTSVDLPTVTRVAEASAAQPCLAATLQLDLSLVRELLSRDEFHLSPLPADSPGMSTAPATAEFLGAWCRLLDLLLHPADIPFLSGLIEREIMYRVLRGPEGASLRAVATSGDQSHRTAKAIAWIRTNYTKPLRIDELAEVAGMAVSTLHHRFRALTGMSPLQYQKQIRLQAARARMLTDDVDAATAAFEAGYESASQFNREYSRLFGQPPIRDVRNLRSPGAPTPESVGMIQPGA